MENRNLVVIYGGSFNPPLYSHFSIAQNIINEVENVEKVIFVPVSKKYAKPELIEDSHRYNMLKLICDKNEKFEVSDVEINNDRQFYTLETLNYFRNLYKDKEIVFLTGTDNLSYMDKWYKPDELLENYKVMIIERNNDDMNSMIDSNEFLSKYKERFINITEVQRNFLSSSIARKMLKERKSIRYLTPDEVYNYIKENNLYI